MTSRKTLNGASDRPLWSRSLPWTLPHSPYHPPPLEEVGRAWSEAWRQIGWLFNLAAHQGTPRERRGTPPKSRAQFTWHAEFPVFSPAFAICSGCYPQIGARQAAVERVELGPGTDR